jgi:putative copper export protein/mono/diheme cytochrome c family protein/peroxiredoxin
MSDLPSIAIAIRWVHLTACVGLVGTMTMLLVAGRPLRATALAWECRVVRAAVALAVAAITSGIATLAEEVAVLEGRLGAILDPAAFARVALETQAGHVWLVRHGLLVVLGVFVFLGGDLSERIDWLSSRAESTILGAGVLALVAGSSHAAAVSPGTLRAVSMDILHLGATGVWLGALLPLAWLLRAAATEAGADARPYAVLAARRFSTAALVAMVVLVASGVGNTVAQVGSIAALVGTSHGRLLLTKLGVLVLVLAVASVNRRRLVPALSGEAVAVGRPAMRRLARLVTIEAALGLVILGLVAAMTVVAPARHQQPAWPFSFRLSLEAVEHASTIPWRVLVGSQIAVLGLVAIIAALVAARRRRLIALTGVVLLGAGLIVALPTLAVDAYPTTYRRSTSAYQVSSIAAGLDLFHDNCARCHGERGAGDGPDARVLPRPPADLRSAHTSHHTMGDLFWWITNGIPPSGMPPFRDRLSETDRWDVINAVRALAVVPAVQALGATVEPGHPRFVAPDFSFAVGPSATRSLREYRGRRIVLLVLYTLPGSRDRLAALAQRANLLRVLGVEVIAVPRDASSDAIRALRTDPPFLFPIVTDGASDIVDTYGLFAPAPHAEFLVDRHGYLRAMPAAGDHPTGDLNALIAEVQQLNEEKDEAPPPEEDHAH